MTINIEIVNRNFLKDIREAAANTQNIDFEAVKKAADLEFTPELLYKYLISEHSPIRVAILKILVKDLLYYSSVHFVRHNIGIEHFVTSNRPDLKKKERTIEDLVNHLSHCNLQSLINIAKVRLCKKSSELTQQILIDTKKVLIKSEDKYLNEVGKVLVPSCVHRCGCPEFKNCGFFSKLFKDEKVEVFTSIRERYNVYNRFFNKKYE